MSIKHSLAATDRLINPLRALADKLGVPLYDLAVRLFMASIFLASGWSKFSNLLNGNWDATIFLFMFEHPVPFLPANIAAVFGTGGEMLFSLLLIAGLFGRFAAAGLIFMTAIIQFTYQQSAEHVMWALLLAGILIRGPGKLSLDYLIGIWLGREPSPLKGAPSKAHA